MGKTVQRTYVTPLVIPALTAVGDAYNLGDDTASNRGAVSYEFQMGKYEVTNAEYTAFLNAVAKSDGFYGLYNTRMGTDTQGGISRSGTNGSYVYALKAGVANKPVNFISVYSAMRYCNWLHNGAQPDGNTESGAYRLLGNIPSNTTVLLRSAGARFFLPAEDEWYKAAFYDPSIAGMMTGNYWSYAVLSDTPSAASINFGGAFGGVSDVTTPGYPSYYGTYGQSGNVAEWTETVSGATRLVRGGHYASAAASVSAQGVMTLDPASQTANVGFRIAAANAIQSIGAFAGIPSKAYGDSPFAITLPVSSSGLPVSVTVKSGPAIISGNMVTVTGVGDVTLAANQQGDYYYDAAIEVTATFTVGKAAQIIGSFAAIPTKTFGVAPFTVSTPLASSGLAVTLSVKSGPAVLSTGNILNLSGAGTVVLAANQAGDSNFNAAPEATTSFAVIAPQSPFESSYNYWLTTYPALNVTNSGLTDDSDGDGASNLLEFAMDRNPTLATSAENSVIEFVGGELRITYTRRKDLSSIGLQIFAETSTALDAASWTNNGVVEQVIFNTSTTETVRASIPMQSATKKFLRIKVSK